MRDTVGGALELRLADRPAAGLADRVEAVDGSLDVISPPGEGTVVRAALRLQVATRGHMKPIG